MDRDGLGGADQRILASRVKELESLHDRVRSAPSDNNVSVLCQTTTLVTYPTTPSAVYACLTYQIDADDTEGASATYTADGGSLFALNLGTAIPTSGTRVIVHALGGRFVFRYDG